MPARSIAPGPRASNDKGKIPRKMKKREGHKTDTWAGYVAGEDERGKDYVGIHHLGFWVDDLTEAEAKIDQAGGTYFMGRPTEDAPTTFYEMKFRDPNGIIVDVTHLGWRGSVKDVVSKTEAGQEKVER